MPSPPEQLRIAKAGFPLRRRNASSWKIPEHAVSLPSLAAPALPRLPRTLKTPARISLLAWIETLRTGFSQDADFVVRGTDERDWQVSILGPHAIVWWVDHPACEVKVVSIRPADR